MAWKTNKHQWTPASIYPSCLPNQEIKMVSNPDPNDCPYLVNVTMSNEFNRIIPGANYMNRGSGKRRKSTSLDGFFLGEPYIARHLAPARLFDLNIQSWSQLWRQAESLAWPISKTLRVRRVGRIPGLPWPAMAPYSNFQRKNFRQETFQPVIQLVRQSVGFLVASL